MNGNNCIGPFMLIIPVIGFLLIAAVGWVVFALVRAWLKAPTTAMPGVVVTRGVADRLVRLQLARHAASCTLAFAGAGSTLVLGSPGWSTLLAVAAVFLLRAVSMRREALARLDHANAIAVRRGEWLVVSSASGETHVPASASVFRYAQRVVLPAASIERSRP